MCLIGRSQPSDIILDAPGVAPSHADVRHLQGDLYLLTDLETEGGTWVNGHRITVTAVRPDDEIWIGDAPFELSLYVERIPKCGARRRLARVRTAACEALLTLSITAAILLAGVLLWLCAEFLFHHGTAEGVTERLAVFVG